MINPIADALIPEIRPVKLESSSPEAPSATTHDHRDMGNPMIKEYRAPDWRAWPTIPDPVSLWDAP